MLPTVHQICRLMLQKSSKAQLLLDKVFEHLELIEKDYFGLQFVDSTVGVEHMVSRTGW